jgi:hypothetical protein
MSDRLHLRAGPLEMDFDPATGWLRRVRLGGREALRAVYPAVRDRFWNTLPNAISNLSVKKDGGAFRVAFDAECRQGPIDFAIRGEIVGTPDGTVTYRFDGVARSTFLRNRIGLCVLHPVAGCAGEPCEVGHADATEDTVFPLDISPHQPFHDVRSITHAVAPGVRLEVRFTGDTFETEDQRNWTDASYKTYPTPLALPFPVEVPAGTAIDQSVTLRLIGASAAAPAVEAAEPVVAPGGRQLPRLPAIGFGASDRPLTPPEIESLRALRPAHLRVDLTPSEDDTAERLRATATQATELGTGLEVAVLLDADPEGELKRLAEVVRAGRPPVRSWLVCKGIKGVSGAAELELARRHLGELTPAARFGVGTNLYFTEWNRARPPLGEADEVGFSVNPQVHAFDDESVIETLDGQSEVAANAVRLASGRGVVVTPVTLRPRFNPNGSDGSHPLAEADPRQWTPFAAAWVLGSVRRLAGVTSLTYFEAAGPRGLVDGDRVSPAYQVFADLAGVAGWAVDTCECSRPLEVEGMVFRDRDGWAAIVANLTPRPQEVDLPFAGERVSLSPYAFARVTSS